MAWLLLAIGALLCVWGGHAATSARRPVDLVGAVAAGLGVLLAALGGLTLVVPDFLG